MADAVASTFGVSARAGQSIEEALVEFLRTKQLLLVVDNCEHVLEAVGDLVDGPRTVLCGGGGAGHQPRGSGPRRRADPGGPLARAHRARGGSRDDRPECDVGEPCSCERRPTRRSPTSSSTLDNEPAVAQVCRRLDGVPLAIELAAARVPAMTPGRAPPRPRPTASRPWPEVGGGRSQRHQTLRAAIDWSYDLLSEPERRLLARMSVFAGGCTRESAEAVCGGDPIEAVRRCSRLLADLVNRSLVVARA